MTEVMGREPRMVPTLVGRVNPHDGAIELLERRVDTPRGQEGVLCVFWGIEHGRRDMYANNCFPGDGWKPVESCAEELGRLFEALAEVGGSTLAYVEPAPGAPELRALLRPEALTEMLRQGVFE